MILLVYGTRIFGTIPDSQIHGIYMGPIWGRQDIGGPHVGPVNFAIWDMKPVLSPRPISWLMTWLFT